MEVKNKKEPLIAMKNLEGKLVEDKSQIMSMFKNYYEDLLKTKVSSIREEMIAEEHVLMIKKVDNF